MDAKILSGHSNPFSCSFVCPSFEGNVAISYCSSHPSQLVEIDFCWRQEQIFRAYKLLRSVLTTTLFLFFLLAQQPLSCPFWSHQVSPSFSESFSYHSLRRRTSSPRYQTSSYPGRRTSTTHGSTMTSAKRGCAMETCWANQWCEHQNEGTWDKDRPWHGLAQGLLNHVESITPQG